MVYRKVTYIVLMLMLLTVVNNCQGGAGAAGQPAVGCGAINSSSYTTSGLSSSPIDIPVTIAKNAEGIDPTSLSFQDLISGTSNSLSENFSKEDSPSFLVDYAIIDTLADDDVVGRITGRLLGSQGTVGVLIDDLLVEKIVSTDGTFQFDVTKENLNKSINFVVYESDEAAANNGGFSQPVVVLVKFDYFSGSFKAQISITISDDSSTDSITAYEISDVSLGVSSNGSIFYAAQKSDGTNLIGKVSYLGGIPSVITDDLPGPFSKLISDADGILYASDSSTDLFYQISTEGDLTTLGQTSDVPSTRRYALHPTGDYLVYNHRSTNPNIGQTSQTFGFMDLSAVTTPAVLDYDSNLNSAVEDMEIVWIDPTTVFIIYKYSDTSYQAFGMDLSNLFSGSMELSSRFNFTASDYIGKPTATGGANDVIYYICKQSGTYNLCGYDVSDGDLGTIVSGDYDVIHAKVSQDGSYIVLGLVDIIDSEFVFEVAVYDVAEDTVYFVGPGRVPEIIPADENSIAYLAADENDVLQVGVYNIEDLGIDTTDETLGLIGSSSTAGLGGTVNITASGGIAPYTYSIASGSGAINAYTGAFTASNTPGTTIIRVTDGNGNTKDVSVTVAASLSINADETVAYGESQTIGTSGGLSPFTFEITSGSGTINSSTGVFTAPNTRGSTVVRVTDALNQTDTVTITTQSNDANLSNLVFSLGDITPSFSAGVTSYSYSAAHYLDLSATITPTVSETGVSTVQVDNVDVTSGSASQSINLGFGQSGYDIKVIAENGETKIYQLNVTREDLPDFAQQSYVKATNSDAGDVYGLEGTRDMTISLSGDTLVMGFPGEDSNATGIDGNEADGSASNAGAVFVFRRTNGVWAKEAYIKASNNEGGDFFGSSVDIDGDRLVVGAPGESSNATGVNGNEANNGTSRSGAVYVFARSGSTWTQEAYIKASNPDANDYFGNRVAVSGDTIVVGVPNEDSNASGINGNQTDNSNSYAGAAYVFYKTGGTWSQQAYLKASDSDASDTFGWDVDISGETIVIGARGESSNATGINGDDSNNGSGSAGAAYVFFRSSGAWSQQAYLKASDTDSNDSFGESVAIDGDTIIVGATGEDSNASGINGDDSDNSSSASGAAYIFTRSGSTWTQQAYVKASTNDSSDGFGERVAIDGDVVVIGAASESSDATGINGAQNNDNTASSGAAYVLTRSGTTWSHKIFLKGSDTNSNDYFGSQVEVSNSTVAIMAPGEDSDADGIDGDDSDNSAADAGAVYVFQ